MARFFHEVYSPTLLKNGFSFLLFVVKSFRLWEGKYDFQDFENKNKLSSELTG
jgi:hypothetical protein